MSCDKTQCKFHDEERTSNCKRSLEQFQRCFYHVHKPLFQLRPELMKKAAKKPERIYNP